MNLKEIIENNKEATAEFYEGIMSNRSQMIQEACEEAKTKTIAITEGEIIEYLDNHNFKRITNSFNGINLSKSEDFLKINPHYYSPDGYIFRINREYCKSENIETTHHIYKIKNPKRDIREIMKNFEYESPLKKLAKIILPIIITGAIASISTYYITKKFGVEDPLESIGFSFLAGMVGVAACNFILWDRYTKRDNKEIGINEGALEKLVEVCEGK